MRQIVGTRGRVIEVAERGAGPARNAECVPRAARRSRSSTAIVDRIDVGSRKASLNSSWADFVGGESTSWLQDPRRMTAAEAFESVFAFQNERYVKDLKFTVTASMFVWRSVFDAVGGFENGVPEDKDWCMRAGRQGLSHSFCAEVDRRSSRPPDDAGIEAQMAAADARIVRRRPARRQGTGARLVAPMGGPACGRAARVRAARLETPEGNEKSHAGDRSPGADPSLSVAIAHKAVLGSFEE